MARPSAAIAMAVACAIALVAPAARGEPRPGTVVGLDLASPEKAAESFAGAWMTGEYVVVWFALDPELRFRFAEMWINFDFRSISGGTGLSTDGFEALTDLTLDSQRPGGTAGVVVDRFAEFDGFMRLLRRGGSLPFHIEPAALAGTAATLASENDAVVARMPVASEFGGGTLVLRQAPGGRWRLLGFEGLDVPAMWRHPPR